jgi:cholesterol oxidase
MTPLDHDVIVIGSGFGGAVSACRLTEAGMKVLVLERGRRWTPETYPREPGDAWLWDEDQPEHFNGWADLRTFSDMWVVAGAGVGGGSLIYANVSVEAKPEIFASKWPKGIDHPTLKPYYDRVGHMLGLQWLPDNQLTARYRLMQEGAEKCGWGDRFHKVPLAVSFDAGFDPERAPARDDSHSKPFINIHGVPQGTCVHCGNCDIGCQVKAKNTLDLNYLAVAEKHGAEIRPLHRVVKLESMGSQPGAGWRVHFDRLEGGQRMAGSASAQRVILAAGSIGSTELLLRCRDEHKTLPDLSPRLGKGWAFNGDFVTPTFYKTRKVSPSHGPTISSAIDLLDGVYKQQALFIEDGGVPNLAADFIRERLKQLPGGRLKRLWSDLGGHADVQDPLADMMPWFGQAVDAADGELYLGRLWYAPWRRTLKMNWDYRASEDTVNAMVEVHQMLSAATGGTPFVPPTWTLAHNLITPHPLGGCNMADSIEQGVVDGHGQVFGHSGLYVMDGATLPRAIGLNPSRTIAALAERGVERIVQTA